MKGTSAEIQDIALKALINDPYILSKCMGEITESYFANLSYKLAYKCLKKYYTKYMVIPTAEDMMALLEDDYSPEYGEMDTIKTEIKTRLDRREITLLVFILFSSAPKAST